MHRFEGNYAVPQACIKKIINGGEIMELLNYADHRVTATMVTPSIETTAINKPSAQKVACIDNVETDDRSLAIGLLRTAFKNNIENEDDVFIIVARVKYHILTSAIIVCDEVSELDFMPSIGNDIQNYRDELRSIMREAKLTSPIKAVDELITNIANIFILRCILKNSEHEIENTYEDTDTMVEMAENDPVIKQLLDYDFDKGFGMNKTFKFALTEFESIIDGENQAMRSISLQVDAPFVFVSNFLLPTAGVVNAKLNPDLARLISIAANSASEVNPDAQYFHITDGENFIDVMAVKPIGTLEQNTFVVLKAEKL